MKVARWVIYLQALMQSGLLHLPRDHAEADAMSRELETYEIKVDANANDTYAFRTGRTTTS